jgi:hypothetical protein
MKRTAVITVKPACFGADEGYDNNDPECMKCEVSTRCIMTRGERLVAEAIRRL